MLYKTGNLRRDTTVYPSHPMSRKAAKGLVHHHFAWTVLSFSRNGQEGRGHIFNGILFVDLELICKTYPCEGSNGLLVVITITMTTEVSVDFDVTEVATRLLQTAGRKRAAIAEAAT